MNGEITTVIPKTEDRPGGYGFIRDEQGEDRFFHARDLTNRAFAALCTEFKALPKGARLKVTFEPAQGASRNGSGNNLRAEQVTIL